MMTSLRHLFTFLTFAALAAAAASAQGTLVTLAAPLTPVQAGRPLRVDLVIFNPSANPQTFYLSTTLAARLSNDRETWTMTLQGSDGELEVAAGGFARLALTGTVPPQASGRHVLELTQPVPARAVVDVTPISGQAVVPPEATASESAAPTAQDLLSSLPAANRLRRYYADHFSAHEPMYFIMGTGKPAARFQLSLKYRILNDAGPLATRLPSLKGLHVAYTQRSLWDITSDSSPFYDTSYSPEVMFESLAPDTGRSGGFTWLGYQTAFQHESNGRGGSESRSFNSIYIRPGFAWGDLNGWRLIVRPKLFAYVGSLSDNPDIKDYRGYGELRVIFGRNDSLGLSVTGRLGRNGDKGSLQFDAAYPTEYLSGNFAMYLHAQYWTGYGESLLNYNQRTSKFRAGFSIAR